MPDSFIEVRPILSRAGEMGGGKENDEE